jgi:hypothetical protein
VNARKTTPSGRATPPADWSLAPRGVVSGTVMTTASIVLSAGVGDTLHINPVFAGAGTVVGALSHLMASAHRAKHTPGAVLIRLAYWAGGGSWLTWALTGPENWHNPRGLAALAIGALGAGITSPIAAATRISQPGTDSGQPGRDVVLADAGSRGREWSERIRRVCRISVQVSQVVDYPTRTGYYVHVLLPIGGKTIDDIARYAKALATDARLPKGCRVDVEEGDRQGEVIISVPTANRLTEEIPYVPDHTPRSIYDLVPLGEYQDGTIVGVPLRQMCALAIGATGSGKTTLLDLFTDGVGHCVDALTWHIDFNGGGMSWSWMQPWINGEIDRPPIDWTASTPEEAWLMVQVAYAIGIDRKGSYNHLKLSQNSRLMPLSADLPEIVIIVDEGKTVLSGTATGIIGDIRDMLIKISDELRDAGVRLVASGLRGTSDYVATAFKVQSRVKIGMPVDSDAELAYLFDWDKGLKVSDLPTMGCGYVQYEQKPPRMFKTRHILPGHITESAIAIAGIRPELDEAGQRVAGHHYATRYQRMRQIFSQARPTTDTEPAPATGPTITPAGTGRAPVPTGRPHLTVMNGGGQRPDQWPSPREIAHGTATFTPTRPADWPDPAQIAGRTATAQALTDTAPAASAYPIPPGLAKALEAFAAANDDRMHSETLAAALDLPDQWALANLMREFGVRSRPQKFKRGGNNRRGYWLDDLTAAADRIARGQAPAPLPDEDEDTGESEQDA